MNKKIVFINKIIVAILLVLLILIPFGTFLVQIIKLFFEYAGVSLPNIIVEALYGWKELLLLLGGVLVLVKIAIEKKFPFKINSFDIVIFVVMMIGLIYGGAIIQRWDRVIFGFRYDFLVFLFYFLARSAEIKKECILKFIKMIIYLSVPIMLFGIVQTILLPKGFMEIFGYSLQDSITGNPLPPYHLIGDTVRAMATFPGPNSLAMYLVFIFFAVLFLGKEMFDKYPRSIFLVLPLLTLMLTFSRGHIFSLISAAFLSLIFFKYLVGNKITGGFTKKFLFFRSLAATLILVLFSALIFFGTFWLADFSKNKSSWIGSVVLRESSTQMHSFMRNLAIEPIKKQPWGHGIGTAGLATTNIADGKFNPESWPIQLIFEYGVLGLIFFSLIIFVVLERLFSLFLITSGHVQKRLILFFATFFISIIISVNFLPSWFEAGTLIWWILFGFFITGNPLYNGGKD